MHAPNSGQRLRTTVHRATRQLVAHHSLPSPDLVGSVQDPVRQMVQRQPALLVMHQSIPSAQDQGLENIQIALRGCEVQGRVPVLVLRLDGCSRIQQGHDTCQVPALRSMHERRQAGATSARQPRRVLRNRAQRLPGLRVRPHVQSLPHLRCVSLPGASKQFCVAGHLVFGRWRCSRVSAPPAVDIRRAPRTAARLQRSIVAHAGPSTRP
mmetsp:Transcript_63335/g.181718  ORF Transcript_63335/g.181718 Transcript_63335/m.181718 type:complete len:210 (-) Transcript_63335:45-674(-)